MTATERKGFLRLGRQPAVRQPTGGVVRVEKGPKVKIREFVIGKAGKSEMTKAGEKSGNGFCFNDQRTNCCGCLSFLLMLRQIVRFGAGLTEK